MIGTAWHGHSGHAGIAPQGNFKASSRQVPGVLHVDVAKALGTVRGHETNVVNLCAAYAF
ncbi:hypothetical protein [Cupriavidus metallidurans]|uniref:hypothetical protein n=1 Tax=Cupriavidus metallidurans TaxID=119219 RepID=UPI001CC94966|nr:hypothetical protein [Cupriavidus metallidurans]UBM09044.1 hypothetical protein LAI70_03900 [Cupriavidus metallidurans]